MIKRIIVVIVVLCTVLGLSWASLAGTLTVSGVNIYFQATTESVDSWDFSVDQDGYLLPDGVYKYEFREVPEIDRVAQVEAEEAGDDQRVDEIAREEAKQMYLETGSFEIIDGLVMLAGGNTEEKP